jgi:small-conductance mechanosensitive channel
MYRLALQACLVAGWLAAAPLGAQNPAPPAGAETADRLNRLETRLDALEAEVRLLRELKTLPGTVDALRLRVDGLERSLLDRLERIQSELSRLNEQPRVARALPETAQLQLVNTYDAPVLIVVDGQDYLLPPYQTRTLTRRPGRFSYEVRHVDGRIIQPLKESELRSGIRPHQIEVFGR